ncbi:cytidylyltransferase domain-containing protein [Pedobacter montanisoli]|uniref:Uncharacterized protein n=1 Tax=Pedobacter montanisoli TaxID=2923277 RepID=A0ABS9ZSF0_9SPHI|nr:hypothetical protein [Pedobacter montanisoli]MCJ0741505.1 hypothetical protein [Pedobacter montanisoli]
MVGLFVTARLGSTRLSQKHLIEAAGQPFIKWLTNRYAHQFKEEIKNGVLKIFITTSVSPENKTFEQVFSGDEVSVFYGSDENIPLRHLECARANNIEYIISIDGDDILCSTEAAVKVIEKLQQGREIAQTKGLPLGMNVMGYRADFLEKCLTGKELSKLETGWGKIFEKGNTEIIEITGYEQATDLRMTLDYEDDATFFKEVITHIGNKIIDISDAELVCEIIKNSWQNINKGLNETYWANFNKQKNEEQ